MTDTAVKNGFEQFVDETLSATAEEFRIARALRNGAGDAPTRLIDALLGRSTALHRYVVQPELQKYHTEILQQFAVIAAYAADDRGVEPYREQLLSTDTYVDAISPTVSSEKRADIETALLDRSTTLGDAIVPLIRHPSDEFWTTVTETFTEEEAKNFVNTKFRFTQPIDTFPAAFRFETTIDPERLLGPVGALLPATQPFTLDFTEEATVAMKRGEHRIIRNTIQTVHHQYQSDS